MIDRPLLNRPMVTTGATTTYDLGPSSRGRCGSVKDPNHLFSSDPGSGLAGTLNFAVELWAGIPPGPWTQ